MTEEVVNWYNNGGKDVVINWLAKLLNGIVGFLCIWVFLQVGDLYTGLRDLRDELTSEISTLKIEYAKKNDLRNIESRMDESYRKIELKIDLYNKAQTERIDAYNKAQTERIDRLIDSLRK